MFIVTDIEWPEAEEALSPEAVSAIEALLTMEPSDRPAAGAVRAMPIFRNIDWDNQLNVEPPFVPTLDDVHDTGYFQGNALYCLVFVILFLDVVGVDADKLTRTVSVKNLSRASNISFDNI